jgi:hypothetical protein
MFFVNPMYGTTAPLAAQSYAQNYPQNWAVNGQPNQYMQPNPMYGYGMGGMPVSMMGVPPLPPPPPPGMGSFAMGQGITLAQSPPKGDDEFGGFQSGSNPHQNVSMCLMQVKWMNEKEKVLIDWSNFGNEIKKQ